MERSGQRGNSLCAASRIFELNSCKLKLPQKLRKGKCSTVFFASGESVRYHSKINTMDENRKRNDQRKFPFTVLNPGIDFGYTEPVADIRRPNSNYYK
jgi:hypothetical protein